MQPGAPEMRNLYSAIVSRFAGVRKEGAGGKTEAVRGAFISPGGGGVY